MKMNTKNSMALMSICVATMSVLSSSAANVVKQVVQSGKGTVRAVVTEAGADLTGRADATPAIQKCIDRVSAAGGGTVVVPPGEYRISFLTLRPHVRLELAGGVERATDGWTPEVAARAMDPARSAIIRSVPDRRGRWSIFLYNLVPRTDATNGVSDVAVSGGVFDCQGRCVVAAFACGRNIRFENAVVKDIPNNHALQIDGCENVVVANCLFAGYRFGGTQTCLTRETIQVEQTSPGAIGNPETSPISCAKEISIPNRNVSVIGCWFGPSERLGPHLIALGHHGRARSCNGLVFAGNVVENPLYCGVRLANVSDARVEGNTFISTNATKRIADDSAVVCVWGGPTLKPGEKGVVLRGNKTVLSAQSPLRKMWVSTPRHGEVSSADGMPERFAAAWESRRGEPYRESPAAPPVDETKLGRQCFASQMLGANTNVPPVCAERGWKLLWSDEFDYADSRLEEKWVSENASPTHILCSRWRENAVVTNGMLRLCNRKEKRGGKEWTSASVWTKARFKYGYFECRYRYAAATGTNNSFWFVTLPHGKDEGFEIDVNEGHYPSEINTNIHDYEKVFYRDGKKSHKVNSKAFNLGRSVDLSKEFHVYGFLWTADELVFYFDGKEIRRVKNEVCHSECALLLSEAILKWAGPVGDAIDGTFMEVDYVRAYGVSGQ